MRRVGQSARSRFEKKHDFLVGHRFRRLRLRHDGGEAQRVLHPQHDPLLRPAARCREYGREAAEFVNLYSKWRGINRFPGADHDARSAPRPARGHASAAWRSPALASVHDWMKRETKLGMPALKAEVDRTGDPDLWRTYEWSKAVNEAIDQMVRGVPPFPFVRESLGKLEALADVIVCSATPGQALQKEWEEHGIAPRTAAICGQEVGSKKEILAQAIKAGYSAGQRADDRRCARRHGGGPWRSGTLLSHQSRQRRRQLATVLRARVRPFLEGRLCRRSTSRN